MDDIGDTLARWLIGKSLSMLIVGIATAGGLTLLGVPLGLILGIIAGLLDFIPYIGPILAGVPAVLIALSISPDLALYTVLLFLAIQTLEGYVLQPLVEARAVEIPPALTIVMQLVFGSLFGFAGIALATPLTAMLMVLVNKLYVEDILGDRPDGERKCCVREHSQGKRPHAAAVGHAGEARGSAVALVDRVTQIAGFFLHLAFDLLGQTFGLLFTAADSLADFFLNLAADILGFTFDLVVVHVGILLMSKTACGIKRDAFRIIGWRPSFCTQTNKRLTDLAPHACEPGLLVARQAFRAVIVAQRHEAGSNDIAFPGRVIVETAVARAVPALFVMAARIRAEQHTARLQRRAQRLQHVRQQLARHVEQ
jgi:hypothetical protein